MGDRWWATVLHGREVQGKPMSCWDTHTGNYKGTHGSSFACSTYNPWNRVPNLSNTNANLSQINCLWFLLISLLRYVCCIKGLPTKKKLSVFIVFNTRKVPCDTKWKGRNSKCFGSWTWWSHSRYTNGFLCRPCPSPWVTCLTPTPTEQSNSKRPHIWTRREIAGTSEVSRADGWQINIYI